MCVVEGHGEVQAVPKLCLRIRNHLQASSWDVDPEPVRAPRGFLVDERAPSPHRGPRVPELSRRIELALKRPADAVLVLCDSDDDCAAAWGPRASDLVRSRTKGGAVMAVREFEAWLLLSHLRSPNMDGRRISEIRDAKGRLAKLVGDYLPTVHQSKLTEQLDLETVRALSDSFDKLVRTLAEIFGTPCPPRPGWPVAP